MRALVTLSPKIRRIPAGSFGLQPFRAPVSATIQHSPSSLSRFAHDFSRIPVYAYTKVAGKAGAYANLTAPSPNLASATTDVELKHDSETGEVALDETKKPGTTAQNDDSHEGKVRVTEI